MNWVLGIFVVLFSNGLQRKTGQIVPGNFQKGQHHRMIPYVEHYINFMKLTLEYMAVNISEEKAILCRTLHNRLESSFGVNVCKHF